MSLRPHYTTGYSTLPHHGHHGHGRRSHHHHYPSSSSHHRSHRYGYGLRRSHSLTSLTDPAAFWNSSVDSDLEELLMGRRHHRHGGGGYGGGGGGHGGYSYGGHGYGGGHHHPMLASTSAAAASSMLVRPLATGSMSTRTAKKVGSFVSLCAKEKETKNVSVGEMNAEGPKSKGCVQ